MENVFTLTRPEATRLSAVLNTNVIKRQRLVTKILLMNILSWMFLAFAIRSLWDVWHRDADVLITLLPTALYLLIALIIYVVGTAYLKRSYARAAISDNGWMLSEQVLAATDDGVTIKARYGSVNLIWSRLTAVIQDDHHYYLLIEPCQGFMVPKQAVKDASLQAKLAAVASLAKT